MPILFSQAKEKFIDKLSEITASFGGLRQQFAFGIGVVQMNGFSLSYDAYSDEGVIKLWFLRPGESVRSRELFPEVEMLWQGGTEWNVIANGKLVHRNFGGEIALMLIRRLQQISGQCR
jgi:hypothetical protein